MVISVNRRLFRYFGSYSGISVIPVILVNRRLGVKRVTEPNRTEPPDYTGQSLRKFPILAVPGFTAVTRTDLFGVISNYLFKSNYAYFKIYLFKYNLLC